MATRSRVMRQTNPESEASASQRQRVVTSRGQKRLAVSGQESHPREAVRQSIVRRDVNVEAEYSTLMRAVTRPRLLKTEKT
jgi:hypothetical protein